MAHPQERRRQVRGFYVFKQLPIEAACAAAHVPISTGKRWKLEAKAEGDDWDTQRAAVALGDENFKQMAQQLLHDYLVQHRAVMDKLRQDKDIDPERHTQLMASLGDSFNKLTAAFRRVSPEIDKHTQALELLRAFTAFAQRRYPANVAMLVEMLEPFAEELERVLA